MRATPLFYFGHDRAASFREEHAARTIRNDVERTDRALGHKHKWAVEFCRECQRFHVVRESKFGKEVLALPEYTRN